MRRTEIVATLGPATDARTPVRISQPQPDVEATIALALCYHRRKSGRRGRSIAGLHTGL